MDVSTAGGGERVEVRLVEPLGALSLVTDLARGRAADHALRSCLVAGAIAERLGLGPAEASVAFYVSLLRSIGCTASSHEYAVGLGGDDVAVRREGDLVDATSAREAARLVLRLASGHRLVERPRVLVAGMRHGAGVAARAAHADCEVASQLASRLGLDAPVRTALYQGFERWDGRGVPQGLRGDEIAAAARLAALAATLVMFVDEAGVDGAREALERRRGTVLDPAMAAIATDGFDELVALAREREPLAAALEREPRPVRRAPEASLDAVAEGFASIADLKSTYLHGHSSGVASLAERAGGLAGLDGAQLVALRRAALLHDVGRVTVPTGVWDRRGTLSSGEWELVRLHAYHGERVLERSVELSPLARTVGMHHERMDGSGYHRGARAADHDMPCALLAACDAFHALTEERPHRAARSRDDAGRALAGMALHPEAVAAVLEAAGGPAPPRRVWPAELTDREVEVLRLIARGLLIKQVAVALQISPSTVHTHLAHVYEKAGVSTRAAAAVFAMEHGLLNA